MLNVHTKKLGTVAVLCLQGQIVTGETEILRNAVQSWLERNGKPTVRRFAWAPPRLGGDGAIWVELW